MTGDLKIVKPVFPILALLGCSLLGTVFAASDEARSFVGDQERWEALQGGEAVLLSEEEEVAKDKTKRVLAGIIIEAPLKAIWDVVTDKEAAPEFVKNMKRAKVIERGTEDGMRYEIVEQDMKLGMFPVTFTYLVKHKMQPYHRIDFKRMSGDLREVEGFWRFLPVEGGKTLLVYQLHVDPGLLIPNAVVRNSMKKSLPEALRGVRDRAVKLSAEAATTAGGN